MNNETKAKVRPVTGHLLIGGDYSLTYSNGFYSKDSWLNTDNPEEYLFKAEDFTEFSPYSPFFKGALESRFSNLLIDIAKSHNTGDCDRNIAMTVLYLPEGDQWSEAVKIAEIEWQDLKVEEIYRPWDDAWFAAMLRISSLELFIKLTDDVSVLQVDIEKLMAFRSTL